MEYERKMLVLLPVLAVLVLTACGAPQPPSDVAVTELLNQRDAVEGEYTFHNMNECRVEADQVDILENWSVHYTRVDIDGAESTTVQVVKGADGEWSLSDRDHCVLRF
jgi:outer membrane biogenesis lipoprotein LolB